MASATDQLNRPLGVLRLSLTARCNLACPCCLPDGVEPPGLLTPAQRLRLIAEMVERIGPRWPLEPLGRATHGTASRWRYRDRSPDGGGLLAVVASVSAPFCGDCNRLRVTADGIAYTCLFAAPGTSRHAEMAYLGG